MFAITTFDKWLSDCYEHVMVTIYIIGSDIIAALNMTLKMSRIGKTTCQTIEISHQKFDSIQTRHQKNRQQTYLCQMISVQLAWMIVRNC